MLSLQVCSTDNYWTSMRKELRMPVCFRTRLLPRPASMLPVLLAPTASDEKCRGTAVASGHVIHGDDVTPR